MQYKNVSLSYKIIKYSFRKRWKISALCDWLLSFKTHRMIVSCDQVTKQTYYVSLSNGACDCKCWSNAKSTRTLWLYTWLYRECNSNRTTSVSANFFFFYNSLLVGKCIMTQPVLLFSLYCVYIYAHVLFTNSSRRGSRSI